MSSSPGSTERRRAKRYALRLPAAFRERGRGRLAARIIDISTHGCRMETPSAFAHDTTIWVYLANLSAIEARTIWCRDGFAGIEFAVPLHEAVLDGLLGQAKGLSAVELDALNEIARRSRWLAEHTAQRESSDELVRLSSDCAASVLAGRLAASDPAGRCEQSTE